MSEAEKFILDHIDIVARCHVKAQVGRGLAVFLVDRALAHLLGRITAPLEIETDDGAACAAVDREALSLLFADDRGAEDVRVCLALSQCGIPIVVHLEDGTALVRLTGGCS